MPEFSERHHNTPEQVRAYIADALHVVDELGVPDDLRAVAFVEAVKLGAGKQLIAQAHAADLAGLVQPSGALGRL